MQLSFNNFTKRAVAGISALTIVAGCYTAVNAKPLQYVSTANAVEDEKYVIGDVNCDGNVDIDDVIYLSKYLKDADSASLTRQGKINAAALFYYGGIEEPNVDDLQLLIEYLAGTNSLNTTVFYAQPQKPIIGDADCDGDVDYDDAEALYYYLKNQEDYPLTKQGRINASASFCYGGIEEPNTDDLQLLIEYLAGTNSLNTTDFVDQPFKTIIGDTDCDGDVDFDDAEVLYYYLKDQEDYPLTKQGKKNAAALFYYGGFEEPNNDDLQLLIEYLAGTNSLNTNDFAAQSQKTIIGDADCDGDVDYDDAEALYYYLMDQEEYTLTKQGRINAAASFYYGGIEEPNKDDLHLLVEYLAGKNALYNTDFAFNDENISYELNSDAVYGDINGDGKVTIEDAAELRELIYSSSSKFLSLQTLKYADVYDPGTGLDKDDIDAISDNVSGNKQLPYYSEDFLSTHYLKGDFNCDTVVNITDAVMLSKYIQGISEYKPSEQGLKNADVFDPGSGLNFDDVSAIAEKVAGTNELPTEKLVNTGSKTVLGDFNCDTVVNITDAVMLSEYIQGISEYKPSEQGYKNADVLNPGSGVTFDDVLAIVQSLSGSAGGPLGLPAEKLLPVEAEHIDGDFNCDGVFNVADALLMHEFIEKIEYQYIGGIDPLYQPVEQGIKNADVVNRGSGITYADLEAVLKALREGTTPVPTETTTTSKKATTTTTTTTAAIPAAPNGDINDDGKVNVADLICLQRIILGLDKPKAASDINGDGVIDVFDLIPLRKLIIKTILDL